MNGETAGDASGATGQQSCGALRENRRIRSRLLLTPGRSLATEPSHDEEACTCQSSNWSLPTAGRILIHSRPRRPPSPSSIAVLQRPMDAPFPCTVPALTCAVTAFLPLVDLVFGKIVSMIALPSSSPWERAGSYSELVVWINRESILFRFRYTIPYGAVRSLQHNFVSKYSLEVPLLLHSAAAGRHSQRVTTGSSTSHEDEVHGTSPELCSLISLLATAFVTLCSWLKFDFYCIFCWQRRNSTTNRECINCKCWLIGVVAPYTTLSRIRMFFLCDTFNEIRHCTQNELVTLI